MSQNPDCIVIFDNFKDLSPIGADLDRDASVIPIMNELKSIRNMGIMVILLHHEPKDGSEKNPFKNSGTIADAVDVAYRLVRKNRNFILTSFKDRIPVKKSVEFEFTPDFRLLTRASKQEKEKYTSLKNVYEVIVELGKQNIAVHQKNIIEKMKNEHGISKNMAINLIKQGEGVLWNKTTGDKNSYIYSPHPDAQKSKNLDDYITENLGFLENCMISEEYEKEGQVEIPPDGIVSVPFDIDKPNYLR